jgi:uncharacterized protein (TIGR02118 family)
MLKQICVMKRRPGMSMGEFRDYYENHHAKLGQAMMPLARRYLRRYVHPEPNPVTGETIELPFDVVMELWWDSREDFENTMRSLGESDTFQAVKKDEEQLFDGHYIPLFTVEEYDSPLPNGIHI